MHTLLLHKNSAQSSQFSISSDLSGQSKWLSHTHVFGMHCFVSLHWNWLSEHTTDLHWSGCSSVASMQCAIPSQMSSLSMQRLSSQRKSHFVGPSLHASSVESLSQAFSIDLHWGFSTNRKMSLKKRSLTSESMSTITGRTVGLSVIQFPHAHRSTCVQYHSVAASTNASFRCY